MKILFVQPNSKNNVINNAVHIYNFEPLGFYYLAAALKNHHDLELIDLNNELYLLNEKHHDPFLDVIKSFKPQVVAFSALTSVRTGKINELCQLVKNIDKNIFILVGGVHAALFPKDFEKKYIDILIEKNDIETFSNIIQLIEKGYKIKDIKKIIKFYTDSDVKENLKSWPIPYRKLGKKYKGCYQIAIGKPGYEKIIQPISSIKTSSGCPFRCSFCCLWQLYPNHQIRTIDSIVSEISSLEEDNIFFADDESIINVKYIKKLADALIKSGIKKNYIMYGRSDTISKNPIIIEKLAEAGLKQIWIGIEGSNDYQLNCYKKKTTIKSHVKAITICKNAGVNIHATAIVNHNFRDEDFDYMLKYTKDILGLTSCHFFVLTPFKGTYFYKELMKTIPEKFLTNNSDNFSIRQSVLRPDYMDIEEFHLRYANLQKDFNSDTMPFHLERHNYKKEHFVEFEKLKRKNEKLYESILHSHSDYMI